MRNTLREICDITSGELIWGDPGTVVRHVGYDSRQMLGDDLFVPTIGARVDGHDFIDKAFAAGAAATLSSRPGRITEAGPIIQVKDTQAALEALGRHYRSLYKGRVIGITGSVGKTTTRELTKAALSAGGSVTGSTKNMNSEIGLPVVLCHMDQAAERAVIEMGVDAPDDMPRLVELAHPKTAVITNIGVAHIEYLGSREGIRNEKIRITAELGPDDWAVLNGDEPLLKECRGKLPCRILFFGLDPENDLSAKEIREGDQVSFTAVLKEESGVREFPVRLSVPGVHNVMNALAALGAAAAEGIDPEAAAAAMSGFTGFSRRLEKLKIGGLNVIDDSYNASPPSMKAALTVLEKASGKRRIAVLADMLELGETEAELHQAVGEFAAERKIDVFITLGKLVRHLEEPLIRAGREVHHFDRWEDAETCAVRLAENGDVLLLKGSNIMKLDLLLDKLKKEEKFLKQE